MANAGIPQSVLAVKHELHDSNAALPSTRFGLTFLPHLPLPFITNLPKR
jgi:hypothetical protein